MPVAMPSRVTKGRLLEGRTVVISGAGRARGIGKATARLCVEHGAAVALLDVEDDGLRATAHDVGRTTGRALAVRCDVADARACREAVERVLAWPAARGRIDVLVNNAGVTQKRDVRDITAADYERITDVVLRGTLLLSQAVIPVMLAQRCGSVVNVSSMSALQGGGVYGGAHYCAAKAGVLGFTRALARELGPHGIRANAIAPGLILTDFSRSGRSDEEKHALASAWPLGRAGWPEEVAGAVLFLASDLSSYVTGVTLNVNGGAYMN
jgi:NAD(P)-dependent dehydrogenase (short-subunit alcohol dehydrogenase family)